MQSAYALPPVLQTSIHNLRTLLRLLSDDEFETEFELERQRRYSGARKKQPSSTAAANNNRKRALPNNSAASAASSSKRKKKNSLSSVTLPSLFARHDNDANDNNYDSNDDDNGGAALYHVGANRHGQLVNKHNNNVSTDHSHNNNAATWDLRFNELVEFKRQHGHCNVSDSTHKDTQWYQLATWCCNQRKNFINRQSKAKLGQKLRKKCGVMSDEQLDRLSSLGFRFGPTQVDFETRFMQISEYKAMHNHTKVPVAYTGHSNLGRWVKKTKELYHSGKLDPQRISRLEKIGFDFSRRCTPKNKNDNSADDTDADAATPKKKKKTNKSKKSKKKNDDDDDDDNNNKPSPVLPQQQEAAAAAAATTTATPTTV